MNGNGSRAWGAGDSIQWCFEVAWWGTHKLVKFSSVLIKIPNCSRYMMYIDNTGKVKMSHLYY